MEGDITTFAVDAVISNDDTDGRMWSLVASAIKSAGGPDIELESVSHGPYQLGSAWFTHGGSLPIKGIIHVAVMDRNGKSNAFDTIRECVQEALNEAVNQKMESVALAAIGTIPQVSPLTEWLKEVTPEIVKFLRVTPAKLAVLLVLYEPKDFDKSVQLLREQIASAL